MKNIGAIPLPNGACRFTVWAPEKKQMTLHIVYPNEMKISFPQAEKDYFEIEIKNLSPGTRYFFQPDEKKDYPDPASHYQPEGVHGPSEVVDHGSFKWQDHSWMGIPFEELILYELHVGTFTQEGTFEGIIPLLKKIKHLEQKLGRHFHLIAESDLNSPKVVRSPETGGFGFRAQWLDDFHHALYVLVDKKGRDRYGDFGSLEQMAKAYTDRFVHSGEFVKFRKRKHGFSSAGVPGDKFVAFNQNHDQIGNRVLGERLCELVNLESLKLAAAALFLSPYVPMLFMGEEYADSSPFFYFVSHSDKELIRAVQEGRKKEFESFYWKVDPPDPQNEDTFTRSKLQWNLRKSGKHKIMLQWHRRLIELRKSLTPLKSFDKNDVRVNIPSPGLLVLHRKAEGQQLLCLFNFSETPVEYIFPTMVHKYKKILDSSATPWIEKIHGASISHPEEVVAGNTILLQPCAVTVYEFLA